MRERGVEVDQTTLYRWVQQYAPEMEKMAAVAYKPKSCKNWRVEEMAVKMKGQWKYPYQAITQHAQTIDF